ncbi:DNA recombination/repair protein RecA, partial [Bradyrhizobium sp. 18BD]
PFKVVEFDIMYGEGISKAGEILDLATELEIVKKSGSWFSYDGNRLGQGRDAVKQILKDNPELMVELEQKIKENVKSDENVLVDTIEPNILDDGSPE